MQNVDKYNVIKVIKISSSNEIAADVGGVWRDTTCRISATLTSYKQTGTDYFIGNDGSKILNRQVSLLFHNKSFFENFGKYLYCIMLHDGGYPSWLNKSVIRYILSEPFDINDAPELGAPYSSIYLLNNVTELNN